MELITFTSQYPDFLFPGTSQINSGPNPTDVPIKRMIHSTNPLSWIKTGNYLKKKSPDLIICMFWMPFFGPSFGHILRRAKRNGVSKVLCLVHNIIPHEQRFIDKPFVNYFVTVVDYYLVMSDAVKADMSAFISDEPIKLARHPIYDSYGELVDRSEALRKLDLDPAYRYILFFGFIRAYKGLDLLIQAMDHEYFIDNKIRLIVAGEYYEKEEVYRKLIDELAQPELIIEKTFFIPDDEVRYYFGAADLVVQPYKSATQSGISQLAIYFEKPMVVTDVGGLKEIVAGGGYTVSVDVQEIQTAMMKFFNADDQDHMLEEVKRLKQVYSWSHFYDELQDLLTGA